MRARLSGADRQTFPKIQENASVPFTHTLYTEHSDVTDAIIKTPNVGVTDLLANAKAADVLKYLLVSLSICRSDNRLCQITDQPAQRPAKGPLPAKFRSRQVILSVRVPRNSFETDAVKAWLQVALNIADLTSKPNVIKPEVSSFLIASRLQLISRSLVNSPLRERPSTPSSNRRMPRNRPRTRPPR